MMTFYPLAKLLDERLKQNCLKQPVLAARVLIEADKLLNELFGEQTSALRAKAVYYKYKKLGIASLDASLRSEIKFKEQELITLLNKRLDEKEYISEIQVLI